MMQARDWVSGLVGLIVFLLGLFPFMKALGGAPWWPLNPPLPII